ncbi:MAG: hypothetical protein AAFP69_22295 [Planctomycetota bacterium]
MRLKSNGMAWRQENAEAMIQLRACAISGRWDESIAALLSYKKSHPVGDYQWTSVKASPEAEANEGTAV